MSSAIAWPEWGWRAGKGVLGVTPRANLCRKRLPTEVNMLREAAHEKQFGWEENFRWRAGEITRLEGFSDAVFAFAVTLLVVSLEVPHTFEELLDAMRGFAAFAICFAMLAQVWFHHYRYFRRYGLQDTFTVALNSVLLFVVLFYVYPLKFVFTMLVGQLTGGFTVGGRSVVESMISREEVPTL